jgi:hypothetical protein
MNTIDRNNRKYPVIEEITQTKNEDATKNTEKLIKGETRRQMNVLKKSPLAFSAEELNLEIAEAEIESTAYSQDDVKDMTWKK